MVNRGVLDVGSLCAACSDLARFSFMAVAVIHIRGFEVSSISFLMSADEERLAVTVYSLNAIETAIAGVHWSVVSQRWIRTYLCYTASPLAELFTLIVLFCSALPSS